MKLPARSEMMESLVQERKDLCYMAKAIGVGD